MKLLLSPRKNDVDVEEVSKVSKDNEVDVEINEISDDGCDYSDYGPWSECSASCGGGMRIRIRS